jgi:predicted GNAT family N-acyltransferase
VTTIGTMMESDLLQVTQLVTKMFNQFEAPEYSPEGVSNFLRYNEMDAFRKRVKTNHFVLVARNGETIVGVIEMRNNDHICLLFVDAAHHRQGIGKTLLKAAITRCTKYNPKVNEITVNSSPFAVPIYQRLGFVPIGREKVQDGIRYIPMMLSLGCNDE